VIVCRTRRRREDGGAGTVELSPDGGEYARRQSSQAIQSGLTSTDEAIPVGQQYRDLIKLTPGVQQTRSLRGPSAGGNGQDTFILFDGVNVTWPQYGTRREPAAYDVRAGLGHSKAGPSGDFNRSGGFTIGFGQQVRRTSFLRSGRVPTADHGMTRAEVGTQTRTKTIRRGIRGRGRSIFADRLFFYGSYYRPRRHTTRCKMCTVYFRSIRALETRIRQADFTDELVVDQRQLSDSNRTEKGGPSIHISAPKQVSGRTGLKVGAIEGSWIPKSERGRQPDQVPDFQDIPMHAGPDSRSRTSVLVFLINTSTLDGVTSSYGFRIHEPSRHNLKAVRPRDCCRR